MYHDAVFDTVSLIALEGGILYLLLCVVYSTHYVFPTVSFVCQTSTVVALLPPPSKSDIQTYLIYNVKDNIFITYLISWTLNLYYKLTKELLPLSYSLLLTLLL
jgi:hypothetical protein